MTEHPTLYALLVGINSYQAADIDNLEGCVNDVRLMERLLTRHYAVPVEAVCTLLEQDATRDSIARAFRTHLINNAKARVNDDSPPAFLFYFAGHGSQAPDATGKEPDGLDETIVPVDSRQGQVFDIKDWELGQWLEELAAYSKHVTTILDCCHAGSGTRGLKQLKIKARMCPTDQRLQPAERPFQAPSLRQPERDKGYVLYAACRDRELARELDVSNGTSRMGFGVFTFHLYRALTALMLETGSERPVTYHDLHPRVRSRVRGDANDQTPLVEGDLSREFLGSRQLSHSFPFIVERVEDTHVIVDGGVVHGVTPDALLRAYEPDALSEEDQEKHLADLTVAEAGAVTSRCVIEGDYVAVPAGARVALFRPGIVNLQRGVSLELIQDASVRNALREALRQSEILLVAEDDTPASFMLRTVDEGASLALLDATETPLLPAYRLSEEGIYSQIREDLEHLARYRNALDLRNEDGRSELPDAISIELKRLVVDAAGDATAAPFELARNHELILINDTPLVVELQNRARRPLCLAVLDFGYDRSVSLLFPRVPGAQEALKPKLPLALGLSARPREQLRPGLPRHLNEVRSVVKVIATYEPADFEVLRQPPLGQSFVVRSARGVGKRSESSTLSKLLEMAMKGGTRRTAQKRRAKDDWTTAEVEYFVVQDLDHRSVARSVRGDRTPRTSLGAYELEFELPKAFAGQLRLLSARQVAIFRPEVTVLPQVPGLSRLGDDFTLLPVPPRHAAGAPGVRFEIEAAADSLSDVSSSSPIRLHLPIEMVRNEGGLVVAVAWVNEQAYLVGRCDDSTSDLPIEQLPVPTGDSEMVALNLYHLRHTPKWIEAKWNPTHPLLWTDEQE